MCRHEWLNSSPLSPQVFFSAYIFNSNVMVKVATQPAENPIDVLSRKLHLGPGLGRDVPRLSLPGKLVFPRYDWWNRDGKQCSAFYVLLSLELRCWHGCRALDPILHLAQDLQKPCTFYDLLLFLWTKFLVFLYFSVPNVFLHVFPPCAAPQEVTSRCWESETLWCRACCCASSCAMTTTRSKPMGKCLCPDACSASPISTALSSDTLWVRKAIDGRMDAKGRGFYRDSVWCVSSGSFSAFCYVAAFQKHILKFHLSFST